MATNEFKVPDSAKGSFNVKPLGTMTKENITKVPSAPGTLEDGKAALKVTAVANKGNKGGKGFAEAS